MAKRLIVHIGTHKTGTTAIQQSLGSAYASLRARGVLYPFAGRGGFRQPTPIPLDRLERLGHAGLGHELYDWEVGLEELGKCHRGAPEFVGRPPSHDNLLNEIQASDPETVVLSTETFTTHSPRPAAWVHTFREELGVSDVRVVCYVRPQWEYIVSLYAQLVLVGLLTQPFEDYLELCVQGDSAFEYPSLLLAWRRAFGEGLEIRPYGRLHLRKGDVVQDFWDALGLGDPPEARSRSTNARIGSRTTELARRLWSYAAELDLDDSALVNGTLQSAARGLEASPLTDPPFAPLTPELLARIRERFEESNAQFLGEYMTGHHAALFESPTALPERLPAPISDEEGLFEEIVEEALVRLHQAAARRTPQSHRRRIERSQHKPSGRAPGPRPSTPPYRPIRALSRLRRRLARLSVKG